MATARGLATLLLAVTLWPGSQPAMARELAVETAEPTTIERWHEANGTVAAVNRSTVAAQTSGTIRALNADVGDPVPAGTLIVEISDTEQRARREEARASLAEARAGMADAQRRLSRAEDLFGRDAVSQAELDQARANHEAAQARVAASEAALRLAEQQLSYTRVRAPYTGVVVVRHVEIGETVGPGSALMTGVALDQLRVELELPQRHGEAVREAGRAEVVLPGGNTVHSKSLTFRPVADAATHVFHVRVGLPQGRHGLYPGMSVKVRLPIGTRQGLLIPERAVLYRSELRAVYVVGEGGEPRLRQVRLGERRDGRIEVLAGLSAGERIALDPVAAMARIAGRAHHD